MTRGTEVGAMLQILKRAKFITWRAVKQNNRTNRQTLYTPLNTFSFRPTYFISRSSMQQLLILKATFSFNYDEIKDTSKLFSLQFCFSQIIYDAVMSHSGGSLDCPKRLKSKPPLFI